MFELKNFDNWIDVSFKTRKRMLDIYNIND